MDPLSYIWWLAIGNIPLRPSGLIPNKGKIFAVKDNYARTREQTFPHRVKQYKTKQLQQFLFNLDIELQRPFLSSNLFKAYKSAGYDFGNCDGGSTKAENFPIPLDFLRQLGRAKHEPCGEHWNISYGQSLYLKNGSATASFSFTFGLFKQTTQILQQINVKKCPSSNCCQDSNSQSSDYESPPLTIRPGLFV